VILSDRDLRKAQAEHAIVEPFVDGHVQPASIDLRLGDEGLRLSVFHDGGFIPFDKPMRFRPSDPLNTNGIRMLPGDFLLGTTMETVTIPAHLVGQINGRSSWARKGLIVHTTAGFIDPGFTGQITLELANVSHETLWLPVGDRICQLVLTQLTSPAEHPYGSAGLGSHYQGQQGVTASAIGEVA
jgi:dCTP deaminase